MHEIDPKAAKLREGLPYQVPYLLPLLYSSAVELIIGLGVVPRNATIFQRLRIS